MRGRSNIPKGHNSGEIELIDRIIETDRSIENQLAEMEGLLEHGGDATLELSPTARATTVVRATERVAGPE